MFQDSFDATMTCLVSMRIDIGKLDFLAGLIFISFLEIALYLSVIVIL